MYTVTHEVDVAELLASDKTTESTHSPTVQPIIALVRRRGNEIEVAANKPWASAERVGVVKLGEEGRLVLMAVRPVDTGQ